MNKGKQKEIIIFGLIGLALVASVFVAISGKGGGSAPLIGNANNTSTAQPSIIPTPTLIINPSVTSTPKATVSTAPSLKATVSTTPSPKSSTSFLPVPKLPKNNKVDISMQADLSKVSLAMQTALDFWHGAPPSNVLVKFNATTSIWSIEGTNKSLSGKASSGDIVSGIIRAAGAYCAQVSNPLGTSSWIIDSSIKSITKGQCLLK